MHFSSQTDPCRYDHEIDRMLLELRAQRLERRRESQRRQSRSAQHNGNKAHTLRSMHSEDMMLFTSKLERQKGLNVKGRHMRPVGQNSFFEVENLSVAPNNSAVELNTVGTVSLSEKLYTTPDASMQSPEENSGEGVDKESGNANRARGLQSPMSPTSEGSVADLTQQLKAMQAQLQGNAVEMDSLRRELRAARDENALMRREMYAGMLTVGRHLQRLRGDGDLFEGLEGAEAVTGSGEGARRPTISLNSEELEMVRSIESVIATCAKRCEDMKMLYGDEKS